MSIQYSTVLYCTVLYCTVLQCSNVQDSTVLCSTSVKQGSFSATACCADWPGWRSHLRGWGKVFEGLPEDGDLDPPALRHELVPRTRRRGAQCRRPRTATKA